MFVDDPRTQPFDEAGFIAAIRARRVVATSGPWLDVEVAARQGRRRRPSSPGQSIVPDHGAVWVDVTVAQTRWMHVERIRINAGTTLAQVVDVPPNVRTYRWAGPIEVGTTDTFIGITADGDAAMPLPLTGTYQRDRWKRPGVTPFAIASTRS